MAACVVMTLQELREDEHEAVLEALREKMPLHVVWRHLDFPTSFGSGNHLHLVYEGAIPLVTETRIIQQGETLCRRHARLLPVLVWQEPCEGCTVLAQNLALRDLF